MLKRNLKIFTALNKEVKVKIKNLAIKLREELKFMSRLVVVSRKREEFDFPYIFGNYETIVFRSFFSIDGNPHPCKEKSDVIHGIESKVNDE